MAIKMINPDTIDIVIAKYFQDLKINDDDGEHRKSIRLALAETMLKGFSMDYILTDGEFTVGFGDSGEEHIRHSNGLVFRKTYTIETFNANLVMNVKRWEGANTMHLEILFRLDALN